MPPQSVAPATPPLDAGSLQTTAAGVDHGPSMKLNSQDLEKITDLTLDYYSRHAEDFWEGTRNHDVSQNIAAMLQYIESERPFTILDFGCGPGRDLKASTARSAGRVDAATDS
jgi:2-polyprenyl-3-methyl-5-hydroxy-6-metoxy-1,4-benzoquinol methylase